ncbi:MAG: hypothetical protein HYY92_02760 [Parcubacteria group bacterium]|nr:hypothetical protein [Parcubacteria group bacterium]
MFYCAGGHPAADMMQMTLLPTAIREVVNEHKVRGPRNELITVKTAAGTEIVKTAPFCSHCVTRVHPPVVVVNPGNPDVREHIITKSRQAVRRSEAL